ncbi:MAG: phage major capsid protein [Clostridia bacterium]|nr:phage major capsid protein [Clostridia bacterium]
MKFKTIAEAFNHYRTASVEEIERRAAEIKGIISTDASADVDALNIELEGLAQAKENVQSRAAAHGGQHSGFNPIAGAGMSFERRASYEATEGDVLNSAEYRSAFMKRLLGRKLNTFEEAAFNRAMSEQRADAYATSANAAAVLPTQTLNEVISKARAMGGIMSVCRSFNVPSKIAIPVGTPLDAASWHGEGETVESGAPSVAAITFDGFEIMKVLSISVKVQSMSIAAFESYLVEELTNCVMACIANGLVNGTGTSQGTGILSGVTWGDTNAFTFDAASGLAYADVVKTVSALKRGYSNGACWAMNNAALYNLFYGMVDGNERPIFIADPKAENIGKILGIPVVVDDYIPDNTVIFGNFNYMGYNLPEGITIEASRESSFKSGRIDYRAMAVADCKPIVPEAFIKLSASA